MLRHVRGPAHQQEHQQRIHDSKRGKAVGAGRFDHEHRDRGEIPAHGGADSGDGQRRLPGARAGTQAPHQPREQRVGQEAPERNRYAQQGGPSALLHQAALGIRPAVRRMLAKPRDERKV